MPLRLRVVTGLLGLVLPSLIAGCTAGGPTSSPTQAKDSAARAAAELAGGLAAKDLSKVEFSGADSKAVNEQLSAVVAGMGSLKPTVQVGQVDVTGNSATAALSFSWTFPGVPKPWAYPTTASLVSEAGRWKTSWQPAIVQSDLDGSSRLSQRRLSPQRGDLSGAAGATIVKPRGVVRIGIDKSNLSSDAAKSSAARLARLVGIDAKAYTAKVAAAGTAAFVEAIVIRKEAADRPSSSAVRAIPGALVIEDKQPLAPTRDFARAIIGTVGEATKEIVEASKGAVVAGDQVGLSGLQRRYDSMLRGTPGVRVQLLPAKTNASASPSPSPSATQPVEPRTLFELQPVAGKPLETTLDPDLQTLAEKILAKTKPASAIVAIRPSTGAILAAANGPGTKGVSIATVGRAAPGSTFKVVSALALLRAGLTPASHVTCPATVTVNGRKFRNFSDYPSNHRGDIDLRTALAQSCNTAFIGQRGKLQGDDLAGAAASLGVGIDYDVGFSSFFGSVPADSTATGRAAAMIGQGKVEASPMAMASVVASVAAGKSVLPHLIKGQEPVSKAKPLTAGEAGQLRSMMRSVVTQGSGRVLLPQDGPPIIAKTGTAEFGASEPLKTHAWMIAAQGNLAVAVFVNEGVSGSRTAGPLLTRFLAGAH
jgi:cell division protein FtsI/penicillin-binding protein 2